MFIITHLAHYTEHIYKIGKIFRSRSIWYEVGSSYFGSGWSGVRPHGRRTSCSASCSHLLHTANKERDFDLSKNVFIPESGGLGGFGLKNWI